MKARLLAVLFFLILPSVVYAEDYIIGEGDTLYVSVWGEEKLSVSVKVRPDGKITIPALGDVEAAGLAPKALQELLSIKLRKLIKKPVVTVIIEEINNNKVYVFGGGVKPGVYDMERRTTLLQLLCQVGEFNNVDLHKAYILRKGKKIKEDFYRLFIKGDIDEDLVIKADDVVFIPALDDKNVYVVGAVNTPRIIEYREGLSVMEAILESGGFTKFAKENGTVIFRNDGSEETSIRVKIKDLIKHGDLSQNVRLKPGDYIVIKEGIF